MFNVSELAIYPVKSSRQIVVDRWTVDEFGMADDRRWMVIDSQSQFITQRTHPALVKMICSLQESAIVLEASGQKKLTVKKPERGKNLTVTVWNDNCGAVDAGDRAASWCSELLDEECRLVYMPGSSFRQVNLKYAEEGIRTGFADGFPFLLISEASLADLNSRLESPVSMLRFRPNIVVSGCEPFAEDSWNRIRIGDIEFSVVKPCTRCIMTTIDTDTLKRHKEPLKTLASYRRLDSQVIFGQNLIHHGRGELRTGMVR